MIVAEHGLEKIRGLPGPVPSDERILWQGSPNWRSLAAHAFHTNKIAVYLLVMLGWVAASTYYDTASLPMVLTALSLPVLLSVICLGVLYLMAWLSARTTIYTLLTKRVVIKFGLALPMTINLPFKLVEGAGLRHYADGTGDIPLAFGGPSRLAYLHLWPHARPWKLVRPEPMLRSLNEPDLVADLIRQAILDQPRLDAARHTIENSVSHQPNAATNQPVAAA